MVQTATDEPIRQEREGHHAQNMSRQTLGRPDACHEHSVSELTRMRHNIRTAAVETDNSLAVNFILKELNLE
jgi:hypothetical protein